MRSRGTRGDVTVVETALISSLTLVLGIIVMLAASGWAQVTAHDITEKTDIHLQSLRSLLVVEYVKYSEDGGEAFVRNISKWDIRLKVVEAGISRGGQTIHSRPLSLVLGRGESARIPIGLACVYNVDYTFWVKYVPAHLPEWGKQPLLAERNFTCPLSNVRPRCSLPASWAFLDVVDPITVPEGGFYQELPFVWVRAPVGSFQPGGQIHLKIFGRGWESSGAKEIKAPSSEMLPVLVSGHGVGPPRIIVPEGQDVYLIPSRLELGAYVRDGDALVHVSGVFVEWRPSDLVAEAVVLELGVARHPAGEVGIYSVTIRLRDCEGRTLFSDAIERTEYREEGWHYLRFKITGTGSREVEGPAIKEFKVTDIHSISVVITKVE